MAKLFKLMASPINSFDTTSQYNLQEPGEYDELPYEE
jgi:hypothetical protein